MKCLVSTALRRAMSGLAIQASYNSTKNNLEDSICGQSLTVLRRSGIPSCCINHITNTLVSEIIVELTQSPSSTKLVANLEELNANLMRRRLDLIELLGVVNNDTLWVVRGTSVGDHDDIDRLGRVNVGRTAGKVGDVGLENAVKTRTCWRCSAGSDGLKQMLDLVGITDLEISTGCLNSGSDGW
ncbi:hypothetical protein FOXG_20973 [Fusarium oxysporum f. sp. lycopersici 4287]|uniref:Uncharacterized protein n=1 Tax=Fusarium oxysporum f. sp. lycopersici (strain 4287 / CBS 123668 / FGSC 9935 / NRRL 34936) TaxID=426428 RepID=A0A0J9VST4_FUSO4|nr:hypothetical protein FOXG_20973 [Fusarium oxysporum f. sp. lycopersici 4287]KNB13918.1 hypothetical protein FOXG_20973 [Fusarium oxysporum f. sp. lycopersici 4287]